MTELLIWIMKYISTGYFDDYILEVIEELPDEEKIKWLLDLSFDLTSKKRK